MRTIKFRIIESEKGFYVQTKFLWWWRYKKSIYDISMAYYPTLFEREDYCIRRVLGDTNIKKERLEVIQYPNLKII